MPIIHVNMLEGRTTTQKRGLAKSLTDAAVHALGVNPQSVRVIIHELDPEHFSVGGVTAGEQPLASRSNAHSATGAGR
jgi:4-oxalocrotonate tautomerase